MDVRLPRLGEGADTGTVVNIFVKAGDKVKKDQTIIELENEKAVAPIPSPSEGTVSKVYVKEGDKIQVGQPILALEGEGAATAPAVPATTPTQAKVVAPAQAAPVPIPQAPVAYTPVSNASIAASPAIRKMADELGIDLSRVQGSARGGRITVEDVRNYIAYLQHAATTAQAAPSAGIPAPKTPVEIIDFSKWGAVEKKALSSLRKTIARRMSDSWSSIPHVTQFDDADITALMELRKKHASKFEKKKATLTVTVFAIKAVAAALKKFPQFNVSLDESDDTLVYKKYIHLGIAVDTEQGLIVPVIRDVDKKSMLDISLELAEMAEKTRQRKISADDLKGGCFTISNLGGIGGGYFTPIINKPEVAILALGRGALKPVVVKNAKTKKESMEARLILPVGLSYDHRVIDGADGARFIREVVTQLENFEEGNLK